MRLLRGSPEPLQDGFFGHAQDEADVGQRNFDQPHLQGHHDLLFWGPQVKEDGIACLGEGTLTLAAAEDASLATLGHISTIVRQKCIGLNQGRPWATSAHMSMWSKGA